MPRCIKHVLVSFHTVFERQVVKHVLGLETEMATEVDSTASHTVIRGVGKFPDIAKGTAVPSSDVEIEAALAKSSGCKTKKNNQQQYALGQSHSPISIRPDGVNYRLPRGKAHQWMRKINSNRMRHQ